MYSMGTKDEQRCQLYLHLSRQRLLFNGWKNRWKAIALTRSWMHSERNHHPRTDACRWIFHEQSRTDRDDFITILWNNIQPGMQGQFEKYGQGTIQSLGTTYDYSSIMHYGGKAFSRNGQPTMVPKQKGATIGQRSGFSKTDIFKINKLYGCPQVRPTTAATTRPTTTVSTTAFPTLPPFRPVVAECRNLREDCDRLRDDGWCNRNPGWARGELSCVMWIL